MICFLNSQLHRYHKPKSTTMPENKFAIHEENPPNEFEKGRITFKNKPPPPKEAKR